MRRGEERRGEKRKKEREREMHERTNTITYYFGLELSCGVRTSAHPLSRILITSGTEPVILAVRCINKQHS